MEKWPSTRLATARNPLQHAAADLLTSRYRGIAIVTLTLTTLASLFSGSAFASEGAAKETVASETVASEVQAVRETEIIRELGAYYSSLAVQIPLGQAPAENGAAMSEAEVYRRLFAASANPSVLLLEASFYPMPYLGTWLRRHSPGFYDTRVIGVDLVPAVTAGFQEPWAVSIFVGSDMRFTKPGEKQRDTNRGYMGYLLSTGNQHIKDNRLIDDDWLEFEWKMKGERIFASDRLSWSFRVGAKWHGHPEISDLVYLGIGRSDTNYASPALAWLNNTKISLTTEFSQREYRFLRQEIIFGKKFPMPYWVSALQFDFGVIYEQASKYSGQLGASVSSGTTLVLRPNIEF